MLTPPAGDKAEARQHGVANRREILTFLIVTAVGWLLFALDYSILERRRTVVLDLVVASATLVMIPWAWRTRNPRSASAIVHLTAALSTVGLVIGALLSGQSRAMALWYLVAIPAAMAYMSSRSAALLWSAAVVIGIGAVHGSSAFVTVAPEFVADGSELLRGQVILVGVVLVFAMLARRTRDDQLAAAAARENLIRRQRDDVTRALDAARDAEERAKTSEGLFRGIIERMQDLFFRTDLAGTVLMVSPSVERYGYRQEDVLGKDVRTFFNDPADRDGYLPLLLTGGEVRERELWLRASSGAVRVMSANMRLLRDAQGQPVGSEGILRDVTVKKQQEEALRFTQFTVDHAGEAVFWADREARFVRVNHAACRLLGYTEDELLRLTVLDIHPRLTLEDWRRHWGVLQNTGATVGDSFQRTRTGELIPVELALNHLSFGGHEYVCAFVHDLTERRKIEAELLEARDRAEHLSRAKSEAVAAMGHEIRTPLTGVVGVAGLLSESGLRPDQMEFIKAIQNTGESLLFLINDLLDLSKIEAGRLTLETIPFGIGQVVSQVVELLGESAARKQLELKYELRAHGLGAVMGDPNRLRQVLMNLIGNAIKFTERGGVRVSADANEIDAGSVSVRFEIEDTGIGIGENDLAGLFLPYVQAESSTSRRFGGTGLGLAICKQLVELMGGEIGVRSTPGSGSVFWFEVPMAKSAAVATVPVADALAGKRALIVDPSAADRLLFSQMLSSWRMSFETADSRQSALHATSSTKEPFDFVLLESDLGDGFGLEIAEEIRGGACARARMILLHSTGRPGMAGAARLAGMAASIAKPVAGEQLHDCLNALIAAPPEPAPVLADSADGPPAAGDVRPRVLVAEDVPVNQLLARRMLEKLNVRVHVVSNGAAAVSAMREQPYDLVLMDKEMPDLSGPEATRAIRREEQAGRRRTPIVALTAATSESDRNECLEAGMDDFLSKPISRQALLAILERWTG